MKSIKFINSSTIKLNNKTYKGYHVGKMPNSFGFLYNEDNDKEGKSEWFNYKGLTYIEKTLLPW
jgi:hypothetical protein